MALPHLVLGSFDLTDWTGSTYGAAVMASGTSRGAPVPINVAVQSWIQDGAIVVTQGYDNREVTLRVEFQGSDLAELADAEAALFAELGKPNLLTWTPADGFGPPSVFVVITSSMDQDDSFDQADIIEALHIRRYYNLRLTCAAFVRSAAEVTVAALAASGTTTTLVDACSATTNWTGAINGTPTTPTVVSGAVRVTNGSAVYGAVTAQLTRTASITTSSTKYLVIDWKAETGLGNPTLRAFGDGIELDRVAQVPSPTAGFTRSTFYVAAASIAALRLDSLSDIPGPTDVDYDGSSSATRALYVDNIDRTDIKPTLGSARQLLRSVAVGGSARTQGSLAVEHATSALGDVLVFTYPDAVPGGVPASYSPPLRQYRSGGGTVTADTALVSGARELITTTAATIDVPVSALLAGSHLLVVRIAPAVGPNDVTVSWTVSTRVNATQIGSTVSGSRTMTGMSSGYQIVPLTRVVLPTVDANTATPTTLVRVTLSATSSTTVNLDEGWLFNTDVGQLIQVACGTGAAASGGPAKRLFIEPATVTRPRPTVRIGHAADRSDAFYPADTALASWQFPQFTPPRVNVLTVTTNALDAGVTLRHAPRWHTHAAL